MLIAALNPRRTAPKPPRWWQRNGTLQNCNRNAKYVSGDIPADCDIPFGGTQIQLEAALLAYAAFRVFSCRSPSSRLLAVVRDINA